MSLQEVLQQKGHITYKTRGTSMEPMLRQDRDLVTIRRREAGERFMENDVVLYHRPSEPDRLILHRIVGVRDDGYRIIGDNCWTYEDDIVDSDILGVLVSFIQNGRQIELDSEEYLHYVEDLRKNEEDRIRNLKKNFEFRQKLKKLLGPLAGPARRLRNLLQRCGVLCR